MQQQRQQHLDLPSVNGSELRKGAFDPSPSQLQQHQSSSNYSSASSSTTISAAYSVFSATGAADPLIPGLSDDLALYCLFRLPLATQAVARGVSKSWLYSLSSWEYFQGRRSLGFTEQWLFVLAFHKTTGKVQWQAFDPSREKWHIIPAMPCKGGVCPPGFGCASIADEGVLFVCGGMQTDMDCPMDTVLKYEMHKNRWSVVGNMSTPRSFFASGMIDGRIYAAGGNSTDLFQLSSAEVYEPAVDRWTPVASMGSNMARYDAAVLNGKLYVTEGWSWPFLDSPRGQIYDPRADRWEDMTLGMREGWTGLSVVLEGHLFIVSDLDDSVKLKMYEAETDSWRGVASPSMPNNMVRPFTVNTIDGKLFVVARSLHVAIGKIMHSLDKERREKVVSVEWRSFTVNYVSSSSSACDESREAKVRFHSSQLQLLLLLVLVFSFLQLKLQILLELSFVLCDPRQWQQKYREKQELHLFDISVSSEPCSRSKGSENERNVGLCQRLDVFKLM